MLESAETISNRDIAESEIVNEIIHFASSKEISVNVFNEDVKNSTIINHVTVALSKSFEFQDLVERQTELEETLSYIPAEKAAKRLEISARLAHQKNVIREFVKDILTLAGRFSRIEINTERLRRAKEFFDAGKFSEGRAILELEVEQMRDEQARLLIKREEYETDVLPKLKNNAEEFLILALTTQADYTRAERFDAACEYFERSIESHANESNVFYYAYFLAKHNQFSGAEKYYRRYLDEFPGEISPDERAMILNNLANAQTKLNKYDEALRGYDEALRLYRTLAIVSPQVHLPDVAMTLNNQAILHYNLDRYDEALKDYTEALEIYRQLAVEDKNRLADAARTLNNLANLYRKHHKYDEAAQEYEEALRIYRSLAAAEPKLYQPFVALVLSNLGVLHKLKEMFDEADKEYAEALEIYRELTAADPHVYLPYQTGALLNLANLHQARENYAEALKEYAAALKFYRDLAELNPDAYQPHVATTLNNLAVVHKNEKRYDAALQNSEAALRIYQTLAAANPPAYQAYVAGTLNNMATIYHEQNMPAEALQKYEETLKIRRNLYQQIPNAYAPDLAMTLINLAMFHQSPAPARQKSIAAALEAVVILIPLRQTVPITANYTQIALSVLIDWGLTDQEIQQLIMGNLNLPAPKKSAG